jgi:hypothetical protein
MAGSVSVQRFENKSRSHAVANAGLDNVPGPQMENQAPNRSCEAGIAIVPASEPARADSNATCLPRSDHCSPPGIEIGSRAAGQGEADQAVHALFPTGLGLVSEDGILAFAVFGVTIPEFDPSFEGIGCKRAREPNWMLKKYFKLVPSITVIDALSADSRLSCVLSFCGWFAGTCGA